MARKTFLTVTIVIAGIVFSIQCFSSEDDNGKKYYRYLNDQGVKVINHTIPPRYAQKGYEIVSKSGHLIKTVPPAPTEEEIAKSESERLMRHRFFELQKRYKSIDEIESAKRRRLEAIQTNISILEGNISGLKTQIENQTVTAASYEREGRPVPHGLMQKIADLKAELSVAKDLLKFRQDEYSTTNKQFNNDLAAFMRGLSLLQSKENN